MRAGKLNSVIGITPFQEKDDKMETKMFDGSADVVIPHTGVKVKFFQMDPVLSMEEPHACTDQRDKKPAKIEQC